MWDTLARRVKSKNELTVVYGTVTVVTDYCLNNNRGNWIIIIIVFPDFSLIFLFSLTFPWPLFNSLTFPGFPEEWPPCIWSRDISSICWWIFAKLLSLVHPGTKMNWLGFGSKVKVIFSGGGVQHSTLPSSEAFLFCIYSYMYLEPVGLSSYG